MNWQREQKVKKQDDNSLPKPVYSCFQILTALLFHLRLFLTKKLIEIDQTVTAINTSHVVSIKGNHWRGNRCP